GDTTLEREFNQNKSFSLYRDAITLLVRLKYHTFKNMDKGCIAFLRKFDYDLYMWEFEHFIEYGIEERNGKKMNESDKNILRNYFSDISKKLEALSDTFTHRDYQSRNLMIKNGNYYIIDFQDALISSPAYDIVALLRDSYICFDEKIINEFIELYVSELNSNGLTTNLEDFRQLFNLQTIQRKLKDGGRFVFIDRVKNNPSFLPYIPNSFRYAALSMQKMPLFKELYNLLSKYVPEFRE
ncbi:MAG: phosphotransferase, partial [Deltaproteobacteria bacterium]|nr:phosphotransferase [Deltaproteobacteria bacterium]